MPNSKKPCPPPTATDADLIRLRVATAFDEWARRYAADPRSFTHVLDERGNPVDDYGMQCAYYLEGLLRELDNAGKLPRLNRSPVSAIG